MKQFVKSYNPQVALIGV